MPRDPLISVILPVYNGERYLPEAVESILSQTFSNFEFIIINDGSTDNTGPILDQYQQQDARIKLCTQANQGLIASLNTGCSMSRGRYIARMDADDISLPERFERQVEFMEEHKDIGILGSRVDFIDADGKYQKTWQLPLRPAVVRWSLLFGCVVAHPSVLMRNEVIAELGYYRMQALHIEDYDLWTRALAITNIANLPEVLVKRRTWNKNVTSQNAIAQGESVTKVAQAMISGLLGSDIDPDRVAKLLGIGNGDHSTLTSIEEIESVAALIEQIHGSFQEQTSLDHNDVRQISRDVGRKLAILATNASKISLSTGFNMLIQAQRSDPRVLLRFISKGARMLVSRANER